MVSVIGGSFLFVLGEHLPVGLDLGAQGSFVSAQDRDLLAEAFMVGVEEFEPGSGGPRLRRVGRRTGASG